MSGWFRQLKVELAVCRGLQLTLFKYGVWGRASATFQEHMVLQGLRMLFLGVIDANSAAACDSSLSRSASAKQSNKKWEFQILTLQTVGL